MPIKRLPAIKARIVDVVNGRYFPGSKEEMKASYLITPFGEKISRVNIVATVIDKFESEDGNYATITIDDGTEAIRVKTFRENVSLLEGIEPGDLILAIGKLKEYAGEVYINGEVVRKIGDPNFESLRKLEILDKLIQRKGIVEDIKNLADELSEEELRNYVNERYGMDEESLRVILETKRVEVDYKPKILELIKSLDEGEGVEISKIFEVSDLPENIIESAITQLLASGDIFEPKPAVFKKVGK